MSESKFSLVDLSALSEPACKLIDVVSQCIGKLYEPTGIRRKAKAEADAALILAEADAERQALLKRAAHRLSIQEARRQKNIENIIDQAVKSLPETVSSEPVDPDWVSRFFDECKDVSNEDLQKLWARLLANEVAIPKSCSRKTLSILKDVSSNDAHKFKIYCSLLWCSDDESYFFPCDQDGGIDSQLEKYGLSFNDCLHFENLGLIHSQYVITKIKSGDILNYFNRNHVCFTQQDNMEEEIYFFPLTLPGIELVTAINPDFNWEFYVDSCKLFSDEYSVFLGCSI